MLSRTDSSPSSPVGIGCAALVQILIVDDHPLFREAMRSAVAAVLDGPTLVEEADGIVGACTALSGAEAGFDLALLDLALPGVEGFDGLRTIRSRFPQVPVVIVSGHDDPRIVQEAIRLGAAGYLPKTIDRPLLGEALRAVLGGAVYVAGSIDLSLDAGPVPAAGSVAARIAELTPQQLRVLHLIRQGKLNKQIAHELKIGETTVKAHVSEILRKLKVISRTQAVIETAKLDLGSLPGRSGRTDEA